MNYDDFASLMRTNWPNLDEEALKDQFTVFKQEQRLFKHLSNKIPNALIANDIIAEVRLQINKARLHGLRRAIAVIDLLVKNLNEQLSNEDKSGMTTESMQNSIAGAMMARESVANLLDFDLLENIHNDVSNDNYGND